MLPSSDHIRKCIFDFSSSFYRITNLRDIGNVLVPFLKVDVDILFLYCTHMGKQHGFVTIQSPLQQIHQLSVVRHQLVI